jgi:hypothetical protein
MASLAARESNFAKLGTDNAGTGPAQPNASVSDEGRETNSATVHLAN